MYSQDRVGFTGKYVPLKTVTKLRSLQIVSYSSFAPKASGITVYLPPSFMKMLSIVSNHSVAHIATATSGCQEKREN